MFCPFHMTVATFTFFVFSLLVTLSTTHISTLFPHDDVGEQPSMKHLISKVMRYGCTKVMHYRNPSHPLLTFQASTSPSLASILPSLLVSWRSICSNEYLCSYYNIHRREWKRKLKLNPSSILLVYNVYDIVLQAFPPF